MVKSLISFLLLSATVPLLAQSNTSDPEARNRELFQAYGYCYGHQRSIDMIKQQHPQLRFAILQAESDLNVTFGKSCKAVADIFNDSVKTRINGEFDKRFTNVVISEKEAIEFIETIKDRSRGLIDTPIKETLLTFNPDFRTQPALEFMRGYTKTFSSAGHAKAKGLSIEFRVPLSWLGREGNRPNIVQFFKAEYGRSNVSMAIQIIELESPESKPLTQREIEAMFIKSNLKEMVPDGGTLIESQAITLEGEKGGMLVYDMTMERLGLQISMRSLAYVVYFRDRLIRLEFSVADEAGNRAESVELFRKNRSLFVMIANSLVIGDAY